VRYASTDQRLRELQDRLARALTEPDGSGNGPEAAAAMSEAIVLKFTSRVLGGRPGVLDVEKAVAQFRKTLAAHGTDPDGPMPEPVAVDDADRHLAVAEQQVAAAAKARGQAAPSVRTHRPRNHPGPVAPKTTAKYLPEGNFYRMPNDLIDSALLAIIPGPDLKGYVLGHRLARIDGTFYVSAGTLAERIGAKTVRHGQRVLARLQRAGLIRLVERGSAATKRANVYQLVPLETLELEQIRAAFEDREATSAVADPAATKRPERSLSVA